MYTLFNRWLLAFSLLLIVALNLTILRDSLLDRQSLIDDARNETTSLALVLERHATDSFAGVDKILVGVAEVLRLLPTGDKPLDSKAVNALLNRQRVQSPLIRAILVVDAEGKLAHDSDMPTPQPLDLSDRDYFTVHRDRLGNGRYLGQPVHGRSSGQWFISLSHRLEHPDGRFAGVLVAVVEPRGFQAFYHSLGLNRDAVVTLYHRSGMVLARQPDHDTFIGRPADRTPLFARMLTQAPVGTVEHDPPDGGPRRILSYRSSTEFPLVIAVSEGLEAVLSAWRSRAIIAAAVAAVGTLILAGLTLLLAREFARRGRTVSELRASEQALRESQARLIEDIAARHQAERELLAAKQASDDANRTKTQFLANMSHELRTPLNAVIGFAEALETTLFGPLTPKQREYLADIRHSGEHLLSLINDILDTTRIETGGYPLNEEVLDLPTLAAQCMRQMEPMAMQRRIHLTTRLPDALPGLRADERAMRQILLNLLSNAVKFTEPGGNTELGAETGPDGELLLKVSDTGIGIAPENLERVLEPFQQVDNSHTRRYQGTGLGLPLVKALVEMHGGSFHLASEPGRGTVATIRLPADRLVMKQTAVPAA